MLLTESPVITPDLVLHLPQVTKGARWWLLWTESKRERRLAKSLLAEGAVPVVITNVRVTRRKNGAGREFEERREVPLFPGYLFANGTAEQVFEAKRTNAAQVVAIVNQSRAAEQIARTIEIAAAEENLTAVKIAPGRQVEVKHGPWAGKRGVVRECKPGLVFFDIETLGQSVPIEIDVDDVEPV
jgi:transcription antitermination factor NusG